MNVAVPPASGHAISAPIDESPCHAMPCDVVVRVIAAGIATSGTAGTGRAARLTLALTPVPRPSGAVDLANWPDELERLWPSGADAKKEIDVLPLMDGAHRRLFVSADLAEREKANQLKVSRPRPRDADLVRIRSLWTQAMGGPDAFCELAAAYPGDSGRDTLRALLLQTTNTPDIHGTDRSAAAVDLSLERALHILMSLRGDRDETRPAAVGADSDDVVASLDSVLKVLMSKGANEPTDDATRRDIEGVEAALQISPSLTAAARQAKRVAEIDKRLAGVTSSASDPVAAAKRLLRDQLGLEGIIRRRLAQTKAIGTLDNSRARAAAVAAMQASYLGARDSKEALAALQGNDCQLGRTPPEAAARGYGAVADGQPPPVPNTASARAALTLGSTTRPDLTDDTERGARRNADAAALAQRRLFTIFTYPSLARLFGFVIDVEVPLLDLLGLVGATPFHDTAANDVDVVHSALGDAIELPKVPPGDSSVWYLALCLSLQNQAVSTTLPEVWTTAKLRYHPKSNGHFLPCTREEIDARVAGTSPHGLAEQIDGLIDLGQTEPCSIARQPRFDIVTLDAVTSTAADGHFEEVRVQNAIAAGNAAGDTLPPDATGASERRRATARTGGLALVDRWRQNHAVARHLSALQQHDAMARVLLDATDLTIGYRLDVGVKSRRDGANARRRWHTLMHRRLAFSPVETRADCQPYLDALIGTFYADKSSRLRADEGVLTVPTALKANDAGSDSRKTAFCEEIVGAWRGDPLGLATGVAAHPLADKDLRINIRASLVTSGVHDGYVPPPLRFGWRYHFGLRAVFAGGVDMPLTRALCHYERTLAGSLVLPAASEVGRSHRRHERLETPQVLLPSTAFGPTNRNGDVTLHGRYPSPQALNLIVRTVSVPANREIAGIAGDVSAIEGCGVARRIILAPSVSVDFATAHGAFDGWKPERFESVSDSLLPRILDDDDASGMKPVNTSLDHERYTFELVARSNGDAAAGATSDYWRAVCVAWKPSSVVARPRGGLKGVDHHAVWGGFPIFQPKQADQPPRKQDAPVRRRQGLVTDKGQILSRRPDGPLQSGGDDSSAAFKGDWVSRSTWNAAGGPPQGDAIFRLLEPARKGGSERQPYYPDPGAEKMVVHVEVKGSGLTAVALISLYDGTAAGPIPAGYPDALPLSLELQRVATRGSLALVEAMTGEWTFDSQGRVNSSGLASLVGKLTGLDPGALRVRSVVVRLEPGEEAVIRVWCLPSEVFLKRIFEGTEAIAALAIVRGSTSLRVVKSAAAQDEACRAGLRDLCHRDVRFPTPGRPNGPALGGLPTGSDATLEAISTLLLHHMENHPIPEIAAVLELSAVHAIDVPLAAPSRPDLPVKTVHPSVQLPPPPFPLLRTSASDRAVILGVGEKDDAAARDLGAHPELWSSPERQHPGATTTLLAGRLKVHAPSTGAVEIRASGAAAAHGRFDDPARGRSRDDKARGLWPKPDGVKDVEPRLLFGFTPAADGRVQLHRESVKLLGITSLPANAEEIDLLLTQRMAAGARDPASGKGGQTGDARCDRTNAMSDGCARWLEIHATAVARHGALLTTRYGESAERLVNPPSDSEHVALGAQWLPATVRPARINALSLLPSFKWDPNQTPEARNLVCVTLTRRCFVRVRIRRPWFSSGEDERIGVVLWPPNLFEAGAVGADPDSVQPLAPQARDRIDLANLGDDGGNADWQQLQDSDLGPGGAWVSRWGADPIKIDNEIKGWLLTQSHFDDLASASEADWALPPDASDAPGDRLQVGRALMPLPASQDAAGRQDAVPVGGFMPVALAVFRALFDPAEEHWFADIEIKPRSALEPFVRLGLVRYQPHAPSLLRVSEPISEWTKLLPTRTMTAWRVVDADGKGSARPNTSYVEFDVQLSGPAYETQRGAGKPPLHPQVQMTLLRDAGDGVQRIFGKRDNVTTAEPSPAGLTWKFVFGRHAAFAITSAEFDDPAVRWSVHIEEVDMLRPSTYPDEPRYGTQDDDVFVQTGPRFMGLLPLDGLKRSKP